MTAMENCCPTCGGPLRDLFSWSLSERTLIANGMAVRFKPGKARIIDALWRARHRGGGIETLEQFMAAVYGGDPDGGPETFGSISVQLSGIRKTLAQVGLTITLNQGNPKRGYRLVPLDVAEPPARRT